MTRETQYHMLHANYVQKEKASSFLPFLISSIQDNTGGA